MTYRSAKVSIPSPGFPSHPLIVGPRCTTFPGLLLDNGFCMRILMIIARCGGKTCNKALDDFGKDVPLFSCEARECLDGSCQLRIFIPRLV